jgi:heme/copper-type cytochrome/quinol oxidase subunit 2
MMEHELFYNREVIIVLFAGIALVLLVALFYIDLWKPRKTKEDTPEETEVRYLSVWEGIPWMIKVIMMVIVFAMTSYTVYLFFYPPNW